MSWCLQVLLGLAEASGRLRQPLDGAGDQHERGHRPLEGPNRVHADERTIIKRNLGFLHRRIPGRPTLVLAATAHHQSRVPPVPAAPGLRGGPAHPRRPSTWRRAWGSTRVKISSTCTGRSRSARKAEWACPYPLPGRPPLPSGAPRRKSTRAAAGAGGLRRNLRGDLLLRSACGQSCPWPAQQDDRVRPAVPDILRDESKHTTSAST